MPNTIADNLARLQAARTAIAGAITEKGGTVTAGDGFEDFATDIATIPSGPETYEVNITYDCTNAGGGAVTSSKTYSEILSAINAGKSITGTLTIEYEPQKGDIRTVTTPIYGAYAGIYGNTGTQNEYSGIAVAIKPYYERYLGDVFGISLLVKSDNTWLIPANDWDQPTYGQRLKL